MREKTGTRGGRMDVAGIYTGDVFGFTKRGGGLTLTICDNGKTILFTPCCGIERLPDGSTARYIHGVRWLKNQIGHFFLGGIYYTIGVSNGAAIISKHYSRRR